MMEVKKDRSICVTSSFFILLFIMDLAINVDNLNFDYGGPAILHDMNLKLERGSRCLLVGANGAGKTTLLRILAGKRKVQGNVHVFGKNAFLDAPAVSKFDIQRSTVL